MGDLMHDKAYRGILEPHVNDNMDDRDVLLPTAEIAVVNMYSYQTCIGTAPSHLSRG